MRYQCYACARIYEKKEPAYCQCGSYQFMAIPDKKKPQDKRDR